MKRGWGWKPMIRSGSAGIPLSPHYMIYYILSWMINIIDLGVSKKLMPSLFVEGWIDTCLSFWTSLNLWLIWISFNKVFYFPVWCISWHTNTWNRTDMQLHWMLWRASYESTSTKTPYPSLVSLSQRTLARKRLQNWVVSERGGVSENSAGVGVQVEGHYENLGVADL